MTTVSPAELARRARINTIVRIDENEVVLFLEEWAERGVVHEVTPGEWALTASGKAMFAGWDIGIEVEHDGLANRPDGS